MFVAAAAAYGIALSWPEPLVDPTLGARYHIDGVMRLDRAPEIWSRGNYWAHQRAAARFPDMAACAGQGAPVTIEWSRMRSTADAEICLFHLAEHLGDPERVIAALERHGMRHIAAMDIFGDYPSDRAVSIHAIFPAREAAGMAGFWQGLGAPFRFRPRGSFSIVYDADGVVRGVNIVVNTL